MGRVKSRKSDAGAVERIISTGIAVIGLSAVALAGCVPNDGIDQEIVGCTVNLLPEDADMSDALGATVLCDRFEILSEEAKRTHAQSALDLAASLRD